MKTFGNIVHLHLNYEERKNIKSKDNTANAKIVTLKHKVDVWEPVTAYQGSKRQPKRQVKSSKNNTETNGKNYKEGARAQRSIKKL